VAIEEFLYQTDVVGAIEAAMTDGGHNSLHLQVPSVLRCGRNVVTSATGHRPPNVAALSNVPCLVPAW
jgi:hypothetical protein